MELLVVALALALFEFAAWRWGVDSRSERRGSMGAGGLLSQDGDAGGRERGDGYSSGRGGHRSRLQAPATRAAAPA